MAADISEADWRHFRKLHPMALDRFSQRVLEESATFVAAGDKSAHERYLELYQLLKRRNGEMAEAFDDLRRSTARFQLARICSLELLTDEEFAGFSAETRNWVQGLQGQRP